MFASKLGQSPSILHRFWIREPGFDLTRFGERFGESIPETQLSFLSYF